MAFAFNTGGLVDHIQGAIAFSDGFGGAIGYACAAGDAVILDFHGHDLGFLFLVLNLLPHEDTPHDFSRQLTIVFYLQAFVISDK